MAVAVAIIGEIERKANVNHKDAIEYNKVMRRSEVRHSMRKHIESLNG